MYIFDNYLSKKREYTEYYEVHCIVNKKKSSNATNFLNFQIFGKGKTNT